MWLLSFSYWNQIRISLIVLVNILDKISWKSVQRETNFPMRRETDGPTAKLMTNFRNFANAPKICIEFRLVNHWCMFGWPQQHNAMDINHQPTVHRTQFFILPCCVIHFMCLGYRCRAREGVRWTESAPTLPVSCVSKPPKLQWLDRSVFVWAPYALAYAPVFPFQLLQLNSVDTDINNVNHMEILVSE
jgi:hypothetical protein